MRGIYKITNTINGKIYVGLSLDIERRFVEHKTPRNLKKKTPLARAFRKYGTTAFTLEVLEECFEADLAAREVFWIKQLSPEYNAAEGGLGCRGHRVTPRVRAILSAAAKAQWSLMTEDQKKRIFEKNLTGPTVGHSVSPETRAKLRAANLGKKQSKETVEKRSKRMRLSMLGNRNGDVPVEMIGNDGSVIRTFRSMRDAAKVVGRNPRGICAVTCGRQTTCGGFIWRRVENVETNGDECSRVGREISACSKYVATQEGGRYSPSPSDRKAGTNLIKVTSNWRSVPASTPG